MPYPPRQTPDSPVPLSMVPAAQTLHGTDLVVIVQTVNDPGQKTRSMTLSQLASFIGGGGLDSITFVGTGGYTTTVDGNGVKYHKNATTSDQAIRDYAIDANGVHVSVTTPNYTKKFETDGTKAVITKSESGLVDKVEVFDNYIQITHQTRVGNQVVTQTSKMGWEELKARYLRVMKDENNVIPIYWDATDSELVIAEKTNAAKVAVPKMHVYGTLDVEKDTTIDADLAVKKTFTVVQEATFRSNVVTKGYHVVENGLDVRKKSVFQRINLGSSECFFEVDSDTDVNSLLAGSTIEVTKGDIVTVRNTSGGDLTLSIGNYESNQHYTIQLNAFCSMAFIRTGVTTGTGVQWSPLGNCEVTIA